ncbi:MAG: hypothetical protein AB9842_01690 [Bacteroidales bacterium]
MHWIPFFKDSSIRSGWLVAFFLLKILAGEVGWYLYTYVPYFQHTSDAFRYFTDGGILYETFFTNKVAFFNLLTGINFGDAGFSGIESQMISWNRVYETAWFNDNRTMIRFHAIINFVSLQNYHINLLIINILSFTGLINIYNYFANHTDKQKQAWLILSLFLLPCLVFWGSVPSKEALAVFAIGILLYGLKRSEGYHPGLWSYFILALGLILLFLFKYYLSFIIFPLILAYLFNIKSGNSKPLNRFMNYLSWSVAGVMIINLIVPDFDPAFWLLQQQKNFFGMAVFRNESTPFSAILASSDVISLLLKSPVAVFSSLTGIFFPPVYNLWAWAAIIENSLILLFIFWLAWKSEGKILQNNLLLFCLFLFLADLAIIGFTTPYAGAIHRYRTLTLPVFLCCLGSVTTRLPFHFMQAFLLPKLPTAKASASIIHKK